MLIGYGAAAVNPYLMLATIGQLVAEGRLDMRLEDAEERALKAVGKGLLKTISKMGISALSSYCGAQVFEAVGLSTELVDKHFTGTPSRIGGIGTRELAEGALDPARARLPRERRASCCPSSASTPGGATASITSGTRRRSRSCSTPCAAADARRTRSSPRSSTTTRRAARRFAGSCASASRSRSRSTRSSRRARSSSGSRPARCRSARSRARRTRRSRSR